MTNEPNLAMRISAHCEISLGETGWAMSGIPQEWPGMAAGSTARRGKRQADASLFFEGEDYCVKQRSAGRELLVDVVVVISRCQDFALINVIDIECLENLCFHKVSNAALGHDGDLPKRLSMSSKGNAMK